MSLSRLKCRGGNRGEPRYAEPGVVGREESGTSDMASNSGEVGIDETAADEGAWDMDQL